MQSPSSSTPSNSSSNSRVISPCRRAPPHSSKSARETPPPRRALSFDALTTASAPVAVIEQARTSMRRSIRLYMPPFEPLRSDNNEAFPASRGSRAAGIGVRTAPALPSAVGIRHAGIDGGVHAKDDVEELVF